MHPAHRKTRGAAERAAAIGTLVAAFASDTAVRTLYPADADYDAHFSGFLLAFGGRAFDDGVVDRDPADLGAALWFPPGLEPDEEAIMAHLEGTIPAGRLDPLVEGMIRQGAFHPHEPHWYLPWIGVRPQAQGTGVGSALLQIGLARADRKGMPCYLEATSPRNAALYARHGFEAIGVVRSPGYPEIIPMWRPARKPTASRGLERRAATLATKAISAPEVA